MPLYEFEGRTPVVDPTAFIAPTATLIGDVHVAAGDLAQRYQDGLRAR